MCLVDVSHLIFLASIRTVLLTAMMFEAVRILFPKRWIVEVLLIGGGKTPRPRLARWSGVWTEDLFVDTYPQFSGKIHEAKVFAVEVPPISQPSDSVKWSITTVAYPILY